MKIEVESVRRLMAYDAPEVQRTGQGTRSYAEFPEPKGEGTSAAGVRQSAHNMQQFAHGRD